MPVKLSELSKKNRQTVTISWDDGDDLNVVVFPGEFTIARQNRMNAAQEAGDSEAIFTEFLASIDSWDILDENGEEMPVTYAVLEQIGMDTIINLQRQIADILSPNDPTPTSSSNGSPTRVESWNRKR